jgi:hypothetical protein
MDIMESLGLSINREKSMLIPCQETIHLGYFVNSVSMKVFLPDKKALKLTSKCGDVLQATSLTVREVAQLIGLIVSSFPAVFYGPLYYRNLERDKVLALSKNDSFDDDIHLSNDACDDILWWLRNVTQEHGKSFDVCNIDLTVRTDASMDGWGAVCGKRKVNGRWSVTEGRFHINYLELLAIFLAIKHFCISRSGVAVLIMTDNTTAMSYVNEMGGMRSKNLNSLSKQLWLWCKEREITLVAQHVPGVENVLPDFLSRNFSKSTEWKLKNVIFQR